MPHRPVFSPLGGIIPIHALLFLILSLFLPAVGLAAPVVSNVTAAQRQDGSGLVDIRYDLSSGGSSMSVSVRVSPDNGATWNITPSSQHLSGAVGAGVTNGNGKQIVWNAGVDRPVIYWPLCKVEVIATDSSTGPEELTIMLPGDVPLVLVRIPAGSFQMGSPETERSRYSDEGPVHTVNIGYDFYMGKYEVTQAQWLAVRGSWPGTAPSSTYGVGDNHPAYYISWNDTQNFITTLNAYIISEGQGPLTVRLPSEAEWEYACRANTTTRFSFDDSLIGASGGDACEDDGDRSRYMWYCGNAGGKTQIVGTKLPNAFGLYDMHGNVWEWCEDWYHSSYTGAPADGSAWVVPSASYRVKRGGYWYFYAGDCRSAFRYGNTPSFRSYDGGFRLAAVR